MDESHKYLHTHKEDLLFHKNRYPKKSFIELIELLETKGVKFNEISQNEALLLLKEFNYYYKLTVYKRNFKRNGDNKFKNLEFAYLLDLASMDMQLRYILLTATLDIEHALKTLLISEITDNRVVDGFDIVNSFFHSTNNSPNPLNEDIVLKIAKHKSHYQYKLYEAHKIAPPAWVLMEVISFGDFLKFFEFYFNKYSSEDFNIHSLMGVLNSVKRIRNASAHNNALLFDLANSDIKNVSNYIKNYATELKIGELFYKSNKIHDILCVFYTHETFVKDKNARKQRIDDFYDFIKKYERKCSYMDNDNDIQYFLKIANLIIDKYKI
ncbi:MAG: Abi family protein [Gudongella sp.]|jgi:hypothetical protein|nr:Abi family protein [Gudongella sp.]